MYCVEMGLMNGSVGSPTIYFLPYPLDLHCPVTIPSYIIVDFPNSLIPDEKKCLPDKPWTWVPTPVEKQQRERLFCTSRIMPVRVYKSIIIHKSQGIRTGPGKHWGKVVIIITGKHLRYKPGMELAYFIWQLQRNTSTYVSNM